MQSSTFFNPSDRADKPQKAPAKKHWKDDNEPDHIDFTLQIISQLSAFRTTKIHRAKKILSSLYAASDLRPIEAQIQLL